MIRHYKIIKAHNGAEVLYPVLGSEYRTELYVRKKKKRRRKRKEIVTAYIGSLLVCGWIFCMFFYWLFFGYRSYVWLAFVICSIKYLWNNKWIG